MCAKQRLEYTSNAFCSDDVQSSSSSPADAAAAGASGAAAATSEGEDLVAAAADEVTAAAADVTDGAALADISDLTVDIKPLASCERNVFTLATTSSGVRVP